jgi:REP element-mobilizing transposase RayT
MSNQRKKVMGQSLVKNYLHIIFSTKHRQPLIDDKIESHLCAYLGGICNNLESFPIKIGGYRDHVHILCLLSKKIALMKFMEEIKSHSSIWIKNMGDRYRNFYWQNGYGAFSVSPSELEDVKKYIDAQHDHHHTKTFKEEFREFLRLYNVDYDERYVWD